MDGEASLVRRGAAAAAVDGGDQSSTVIMRPDSSEGFSPHRLCPEAQALVTTPGATEDGLAATPAASDASAGVGLTRSHVLVTVPSLDRASEGGWQSEGGSGPDNEEGTSLSSDDGGALSSNDSGAGSGGEGTDAADEASRGSMSRGSMSLTVMRSTDSLEGMALR